MMSPALGEAAMISRRHGHDQGGFAAKMNKISSDLYEPLNQL